MELGDTGSILLTTLMGFARFITKTTSAKFTDAEIKALLNSGYHEYVNEIIASGGDLDFNIETEDADLVAATRTYSVTGSVLALKRLQVTYDGTNYRTVKLIDLEERTRPMNDTLLDSDFSQSKPYAYFYLDDETMKFDLYPMLATGETTVSNAIKIWKILEITELSAKGDEPSIPEAYQKYLCYHAAEHYFESKELWKKLEYALAKKAEILGKAIIHHKARSPRQSYVMGTVYGSNYGK